MDELPTFRLFADPVGEGAFVPTDEACELCGKVRGWTCVGASYGGVDEVETLCPWCVADGTAAARGYHFDDPTIYPVRDGSPQLPPEDAAEVEGRTPEFTTWQGVNWQMCCGRACRYIGEAKAEDLKGRWAGAVEPIFGHMRAEDGWDDARIAEVVEAIGRGDPAAYVFECVVCGKLHGFWDMS
jgi:uncharacterized protein CbrC (UPF0167 family)